MSKVLFTLEQQQAIEAREQEILVAAAAGSGKTAVLVERIITLVLNERIDITKLVILTFTNAAAAQMRRRLRDRLEALMEHVGESEKEFLQKQVLLLPVAHISTFHAYCMSILRNYYQFAALSPHFKIIEENSLSLLKEEALAQTIEAVLENKKDHAHVLDYFVVGNKLQRLETIIGEIYDKTRSYAFVDTWVQKAIGFTHDDEMIKQFIESYIVSYYQQLNVWSRQLHEMEYALNDFQKNKEVVVQLIVALKQFSMIPYEASIMQLRLLQFPKWPAIKKADATPESAKAHDLFGKLKKEMMQYSEQNATPDEIAHEQRTLAPIVSGLLVIVQMYGENLTKLKEARDVLDFSDVEHKLVALLTTNETLRHDIAQNIAEILVDEYQDTNEIQDTILQLLKDDDNRLFMVGDIKQSIYRFRLADPTIFLKKKEQYEGNVAPNGKRLIILNKNFRSSGNILSTVNTVFTSLFKLDIQYPAEEQLYIGDATAKSHHSNYTKWHFFTEKPGKDISQIQTIEEKKATAIVNEIIRLVEEEQIFDPALGGYRSVQLSDIALLSRTRNSKLMTYVEQKLEEGQIHYSLENDKGYFDAVEVNVILALLQVLENPYNSLAFLATLRSPICAITDEELLVIAEAYRQSPMVETDKFYSYVSHYIANHENDLANRLAAVLQQFTSLRNKLTVMPVSEVLEVAYQMTKYYNFVGTLPHGHVRQLNLDMLVSLARGHEARGKNSLLQFNKYMKNVQKNERDFAVAKPKGKSEDTLSMMTIHKAKGLEFPIVFLIDLDKKFNEQDVRTPYQLSKEYGLALQYRDLEQKIRYKTQHYQFIARQVAFDMKAEELRVLYVALTRPMQQLHLFLEESEDFKALETTADILNLHSYGEALASVYERTHGEHAKWHREDISLKSIVRSKQLLGAAPVEATEPEETSALTKAEMQAIHKKMNMTYKYHNFENYLQKHTVTELKDRLLAREATPTDLRDPLAEKTPKLSKKVYEEIPQFMQTDGLSPLEKGTLYHFILEHYPWDELPTVQAHLKNMVMQSLLTEEDIQYIQPERVYKMVRELHADYLAKGFEIVAQELPFAFTHEAKALYNEPLFTNETLLIQGKIDMLLRKGDSFVVIDFKTDALRTNETLAQLNDKYENQLFFYREAVRKAYETEDVKTKIYAIFG